MVCMGVDKNCVPKVYKCEICNPRLLKFSVAEAKAIQVKYLEMKKRKKFAKPKARRVDPVAKKRAASKTVSYKLNCRLCSIFESFFGREALFFKSDLFSLIF